MIIMKMNIRFSFARRLSLLFLVVFAGIRLTAQPLKTFETLKNHALFLSSGHDRYGVFADEDLRIVKVTNLNRSGEGSLTWAIRQEGPRIIIFEVGGVIDLDGERLKIGNPYVFIAGQTAPSPGITLIKGGISVGTHDVIVQHISVRPGDCGLPEKSGWEADGLSTNAAYNVLVDHCSFTWATDENLSASGPRHDGADNTSHDITFSNCLIAECLYRSTHSKVIHSMGTLIHDYCRNIAVVRNLYAHNNQRNPMIKPNASAFVANNLIYNPKNQAIHASWPLAEYAHCPDSLRKARMTVIGNVMIPGADTKPDIYLIYGKLAAYQKDNMISLNMADTNGERPDRIVSPEVEKLDVQPIWPEKYHLLAAREVAASVTGNAGARPGSRGPVDRRIIDDVVSGKGRVINGQDEVGGYPLYPPAYRRLSVPGKNVERWLEKIIN